MMFNAYWEALDFELPLAPATARSGWQRWIDTSLESPEDIMDVAAAHRCPERNTAWRLAQWQRCLFEPTIAPGPSSS